MCEKNIKKEMDLCQYKDLLGKPGEGVHSWRIFDVAVFDVLLTIGGAFVLSVVLSYSFVLILVVLIISGIILHHAFCVDTTVEKYLFGG